MLLLCFRQKNLHFLHVNLKISGEGRLKGQCIPCLGVLCQDLVCRCLQTILITTTSSMSYSAPHKQLCYVYMLDIFASYFIGNISEMLFVLKKYILLMQYFKSLSPNHQSVSIHFSKGGKKQGILETTINHMK